jgi:gas vesicle protein
MFGRRTIDTEALQSELQAKQAQLLERLEMLDQGKKQKRGKRFWFGLLLGGAAGAAAFYLLDPEKGEERRQGLLGAAGGGADAAAQRDQEINARVEADVFRDSSVPKGQININTVDGVVYIRGTVSSQQQISDIEERAKAVSGVDAVINLLRLPAPAR